MGSNYKDWSYSASMAIGGAKQLGLGIRMSVKEPKHDDPKYFDWVSKNILMNWILNLI